MSREELTVQPLEVCGVTGAFTKGFQTVCVLSERNFEKTFPIKTESGSAVVVLIHAFHVAVV